MPLRHFFLLALLLHCSNHQSPDISGELPPQPDASVSTSTNVSTFAIDTLFVGDRVSDGDGGAIDWTRLGLNLDGLLTTVDSGGVCTLDPDASAQVQVDGVNGIDNSFGANVMPLLANAFFLSQPSAQVTQAIKAGTWTLQIEVRGLSGETTQTATGLDVQVFVGIPLLSPPTFGKDLDWGVMPSSLEDGKSFSNGALVHFSDAYVSNGVVVARGATEPLVLPMRVTFSSYTFVLTVHHSTLAFRLVDNDTVVDGVIAGVVSADEIADALRKTGSVCASQTVSDEVRAAVATFDDILDDTSNAANVPCDAISIGLGFTARRIANPDFVGQQPVLNDPCADAGSD